MWAAEGREGRALRKRVQTTDNREAGPWVVMQPRGIRLPTKVWKVQALKCDGGPFLPRDISCCFSEYAKSCHPWVFPCCAVLLAASHWVLFQLPKEATTLSFQSSLMAPQCNSVDGHEYFRTYSLPEISLVMVIILNWYSMLWYWPEGSLQFCQVCHFHKNRIARSYRLILHTVHHLYLPWSTQNLTLPFQRHGMWLRSSRYLSKKGLPSADSYGRVSPKQSPRWPSLLFCMLNKTSPRLELSLCAWDAEPKYRTFQSCTDWIDFAVRWKVSFRTTFEKSLHWLDWLCRKRKGKCQDFICSWHSSPWTTCHLHFTVHSSVTSSQTQNVAE